MTQQLARAQNRPISALDACRKYDQAMAEAEQLWRSATFATALLGSPSDRLAAAQMVRDAVFGISRDLSTTPARTEGGP
jgi:hypothetical protein